LLRKLPGKQTIAMLIETKNRGEGRGEMEEGIWLMEHGCRMSENLYSVYPEL